MHKPDTLPFHTPASPLIALSTFKRSVFHFNDNDLLVIIMQVNPLLLATTYLPSPIVFHQPLV